MSASKPNSVSAIVPTIGRPDSLRDLLDSLCLQTRRPDEVIVADGSGKLEIERVVSLAKWADAGLLVRRIAVSPPNAVRQRVSAIECAGGKSLLLLDDDVVLEPTCLEQLLSALALSDHVVAAVADFNNQRWSSPTTAWRWYLRIFHGVRDNEWWGQVVGPLLRFGFPSGQTAPTPMAWVGAGNTLVRRDAFDKVGGFSSFFLHRCTMNEDVDLGLKLAKVGQIIFSPQARMAHHHAPSGRVPASVAAEDDVHNRFMVMHCTIGRPRISALGLSLVYVLIETVSNLVGAVKRANFKNVMTLLSGRMRGLGRIIWFCINGHRV